MMTLLFSAQGRINRAKYWLGLLVMYAAAAVIGVAFYLAAIPNISNVVTDATGKVTSFGMSWTPILIALTVVAVAFYVAAIWASICLAAKRFHDRDASGWKMCIVFIPVVGGIWFFVEVACLSGTPGPNRFGPNPLGSSYSSALAV